jgi:NAD(P)H-hydrate epimerase
MRLLDSHKGENGKVAVVGGSKTMHGAPLFSALAAEAAGVDLLYVALPACHASVARMQSLNFQVQPFAGDDLAKQDIDALLRLLATVDCAVIGPGIARDARSLAALQELIVSATCPMVLDASALQPWTLQAVSGKKVVCTPHLGELERMGVLLDAIGAIAQEHGMVIHAKGPKDRIAAADGTVREIAGGNPGMTVGGTGDALAGLIAGLVALGDEPAAACVQASTILKGSADALMKDYGFAYGTRRVIDAIPMTAHRLSLGDR